MATVKQLLDDKVSSSTHFSLFVTFFWSQKFDVNDIANDKKQTPLLWAAVMGRTEIGYLLLERGAFLDYVDFEGQ